MITLIHFTSLLGTAHNKLFTNDTVTLLILTSGDSELDRMSSGWITCPSLSKFGGSYPQGFQTCPFSVGVTVDWYYQENYF